MTNSIELRKITTQASFQRTRAVRVALKMADADMTATLNNLTVLELQQELKKRGLKRSGLKPKLVARLAEVSNLHVYL